MMKVVIAMARLYRSSYSRRCGKRRYPTRDDALPALASCKGSANDRREECRAHPCPRCSGWHLTSIANAEECNAWDSPARLWIAAAASV